MNRKEISEKQIAKLPPHVLEKNGIGKGGTGSTRINELIIFAFNTFGLVIGVKRTGQRVKITDCPDNLKPVFDEFWRTNAGGYGDVDGDEYILK
jgi:hypothetical protein